MVLAITRFSRIVTGSDHSVGSAWQLGWHELVALQRVVQTLDMRCSMQTFHHVALCVLLYIAMLQKFDVEHAIGLRSRTKYMQ